MRSHAGPKLTYILILAVILSLSLVQLNAASPAAGGGCPDFYWQNPLPQGNSLNDIEILGDRSAIAVGDNGVILKTSDGGTNWVSLPSGVQTDLYAVSAADANVIWAVGDEGTILKTVDGGSNWVQQYGPVGSEIYGVSAVNANVAWAASGGDIVRGGVVIRTTDGGNNWEDKSPGTFPILSDVDALSADFAWLCGAGVIAKTTDGGTNWDTQTPAEASYYYRIQTIDTNRAMVVGRGGTFQKTTNGGGLWSKMDLGVDLDLLSLHFLDGNTGWVVGENGLIARTGDGGASWHIQNSNTSLTLLGVVARDANRAWVSGEFGLLLYSGDGGRDWRELSSGDTDGLFGLCAVGDRTLWAAGFDSSILKSNDGGNSWKRQAAPVAVDYFGISAASDRIAWAVGEGGTIIHTVDGGATWFPEASGVTGELDNVTAIDSEVAWAAGGGQAMLLRTVDSGANWDAINPPNALMIRVEAVDRLTAWVYGTGKDGLGYVARTTDGGLTWQEQGISMGPDYMITTVTCISAVDAKTAYATVVCTAAGQVGDFSVVFKTDDWGNHWVNTLAPGEGFLDLFGLAAADADTAWAGGLHGTVIKTVDGGANWAPQEALTDNIVNAIVATDDQTAWIAARGGNILRTTSPVVYAVSPNQGMNTDDSCVVDVRGTGFQAGMAVDLEKSGETTIQAGNVSVVSPQHAICTFDLRGAAEGAWDLKATNSNGLAGSYPEAFHVVSATRWYMAEGSTGSDGQGGFETWILLQNPGPEEAMVAIYYLTGSGEVPGPVVPLAPETRATINVAGTVAGDWNVSTVVEADRAVIVERAVYWNTAGGPYRQSCGESIASPYLSREWFLAEGSTGSDANGGFETWILLGNPGGETATVELTYMTPGGAVPGPTVDVAPGTRLSVNAAGSVPGEWHVSTLVDSDLPIIAERAMYWNSPSVYRMASQTSIGASQPAMQWYLAEGSTGSSDQGLFETWVLVENPNDYTASVEIFYQTPDGQTIGPSFELLPHTRASWNVAQVVPGQDSVSTVVKSNNPVVAERAVYWSTPGWPRLSATGSIGVTAAATRWDLAEGSTGSDAQGSFETWILVQNPSGTAADVRIDYMTPTGLVAGPVFNLPARSRISIPVTATVPNEWSVSATVTSNIPVVAERAMYWSMPGISRLAASASIGFSMP